MTSTMGGKLTELRKRKNITQEQVAEQFGVTPQAVSKWENDLSCPDVTLLPQLADYFNVTLDELMRSGYMPEVRLVPEDERKDLNKMLLKVIVNTQTGDRVRINLPLSLVQAALDIGTKIPQLMEKVPLENIDFAAILQAAHSGVIGKLVEVETVNGDNVEVYIE